MLDTQAQWVGGSNLSASTLYYIAFFKVNSIFRDSCINPDCYQIVIILNVRFVMLCLNSPEY